MPRYTVVCNKSVKKCMAQGTVKTRIIVIFGGGGTMGGSREWVGSILFLKLEVCLPAFVAVFFKPFRNLNVAVSSTFLLLIIYISMNGIKEK